MSQLALIKKVCNKCGEPKKLSAYYKHNGMSSGYLSACKECYKKIITNEGR